MSNQLETLQQHCAKHGLCTHTRLRGQKSAPWLCVSCAVAALQAQARDTQSSGKNKTVA